MSFIIGVDEAGRGPLAGPVSVGAFGASSSLLRKLLKLLFNNKLRDSKQLSEARREEIYKKLLILRREGKVSFSVSHISNKVIDKRGISKAVALGVAKSLDKVMKTKGSPCMVRLDGLLKAPEQYKQKTIIRGDESDLYIACASIVAKVSRDRLMRRLSKRFPKYQLYLHKGYGTLKHRKLIRQYGLSSLHRMSFCANI